jgi:hypothetical protein
MSRAINDHRLNKKRALTKGLFFIHRNYMESKTVENTLPMAGPSRDKITITTIATRTRINAYSTSP